jgi:oxygen-independent coproporphyrinogen-3 oxidase
MKMTFSNINEVDLLKKYSATASRYTCYPPTSEFHTAFSENQYLQHANLSNMCMLPKDLALSIHIPFYRSLGKLYQVDTQIATALDSAPVNYLSALNKEIALHGRLFNNDRLVKRIYFGKGTPNVLNTDQIADILDQIASQFHLDVPGNIQMSIILSPSESTPMQVRELAELGFNRFSISVPDFSSEVQTAISIQQQQDNALAIIAAAKKVNAIVNIDLIRGLPKQTNASFKETLDQVVATKVARITTKEFTELATTLKTKRKICGDELADIESRLPLIELTRDTLLGAGYEYIGLEQFAHTSDTLAIALRNNCLQLDCQSYKSFNDTDIVGLGPGAKSNFETAYAQNQTSVSKYSELIEGQNLPIASGLVLTGDDRLRAHIIKQIMCQHSVDLSQTISAYIDRESTMTLLDYFQVEMGNLTNLVNDGLISPTKNGFDITEMGRYYTQPIAAIFDRYLNPFDTLGNVIQLVRPA